MTDRTNRIDLAQAVLLDDPALLRDLVARAVQALSVVATAMARSHARSRPGLGRSTC